MRQIAVIMILLIMFCSCSEKEGDSKMPAFICLGVKSFSLALSTHIWPQVFIDENFEYPTGGDGTQIMAMAIADALEGWALCHAGAEVPPNFGYGMIKCSKAAMLSATEIADQDFLMKKADEIMAEIKPYSSSR